MVQVHAAPFFRASAVAILVLGLSLTGATAQSGSGAPAARAVSVQLANGVTFNWLVKKSHKGQITNPALVSSQGAPAVKTRYFGKGSYICSPAGFGKKSRCFAR